MTTTHTTPAPRRGAGVSRTKAIPKAKPLIEHMPVFPQGPAGLYPWLTATSESARSIAVVGLVGIGKTTLCAQIAAHFATTGRSSVVVADNDHRCTRRTDPHIETCANQFDLVIEECSFPSFPALPQRPAHSMHLVTLCRLGDAAVAPRELIVLYTRDLNEIECYTQQELLFHTRPARGQGFYGHVEFDVYGRNIAPPLVPFRFYLP